MGMIANYMMVDNETLDRLKSSDNIFEVVEELEQDGHQIFGLDKYWDALHFVLTGVSASTPISDNPLSEAIAGAEIFDLDYDSEDYITYISANTLPDIISALTQVNMTMLVADIDIADFIKQEIYPGFDEDQDLTEFNVEMENALIGLIRFYKSVVTLQENIVVSIY